MVDPQQLQQAAREGVLNWTINGPDLLTLIGCAFLFYGRFSKMEAQIAPIVTWWNKMQEADHHLGRRWTDGPGEPQKNGR